MTSYRTAVTMLCLLLLSIAGLSVAASLLYLGGDNSHWLKEHIEEWDAAVAEYHLI